MLDRIKVCLNAADPMEQRHTIPAIIPQSHQQRRAESSGDSSLRSQVRSKAMAMRRDSARSRINNGGAQCTG